MDFKAAPDALEGGCSLGEVSAALDVSARRPARAHERQRSELAVRAGGLEPVPAEHARRRGGKLVKAAEQLERA